MYNNTGYLETFTNLSRFRNFRQQRLFLIGPNFLIESVIYSVYEEKVKPVGFKLSEVPRLRSCHTQQGILHQTSSLNSRPKASKILLPAPIHQTKWVHVPA